MSITEPKYWGSWKGRILTAITTHGEQTWTELLEKTGLTKRTLNRALAELYDRKIVTKTKNRKYRIEPTTYKEYKKHIINLKNLNTEIVSEKWVEKFRKNRKADISNWLKKWESSTDLELSLDSKHFFLEGSYLDDISKKIITQTESEVLVVNPYVCDCDLSNTLRKASKNGREVVLITRKPDKPSNLKYHQILKEEGIHLVYNKKVHAKLIVRDRAIAIISSMNFYGGSSAGVSWEAGIVSIEDSTVEKITDSILALRERPESKDK